VGGEIAWMRQGLLAFEKHWNQFRVVLPCWYLGESGQLPISGFLLMFVEP